MRTKTRDSKSRQAMRRQSRFYFTVSPTVVLWATELPVAVTVKCEFPVAAPADLVRVIVDDPFPGALSVFGLKLAVMPDGNPETAKLIEEPNPPRTAAASFTAPLLLELTVTVLTLDETVNPCTFS